MYAAGGGGSVGGGRCVPSTRLRPGFCKRGLVMSCKEFRPNQTVSATAVVKQISLIEYICILHVARFTAESSVVRIEVKKDERRPTQPARCCFANEAGLRCSASYVLLSAILTKERIAPRILLPKNGEGV